jgi:uncharacterized membrane protein
MMVNWIIGIVIIAAVVLFFRMHRKTMLMEAHTESVLEILEKSYTKGEISIEEYLELPDKLKKIER